MDEVPFTMKIESEKYDFHGWQILAYPQPTACYEFKQGNIGVPLTFEFSK